MEAIYRSGYNNPISKNYDSNIMYSDCDRYIIVADLVYEYCHVISGNDFFLFIANRTTAMEAHHTRYMSLQYIL